MKRVIFGLTLLLLVGLMGCNSNKTETIVETKRESTVEVIAEDIAADDFIETPVAETNVQQQIVPQNPKCVDCGAECEIGHMYCGLHECWEFDCIMQQKHMSVYCVAHSCLLCGSANTYGSAYCSTHKCNRCENAVVGRTQYCVSHKCLLCDSEISGSGPYCSRHK